MSDEPFRYAAHLRYRDLSLTRARRLILAAIRAGQAGYKAMTSQIANKPVRD